MEPTTVKKFNTHKAEIQRYAAICEQLVINNDNDLQVAKDTIKEAVKIKSFIEEKRKEAVRPHLDAQEAINLYSKELILPIDQAVNFAKGKILTYEQEKERKRLEELRKLEEARKAREDEERKERERVEGIKKKLSDFENQSIESIRTTDSIIKIDYAIKLLENGFSGDFQEFAPEAEKTRLMLLEKAKEQKAYLLKLEEQKAEAARLDGVAKEQAELKAKQDAEARKLQEEQDKIAKERQEIENQKIQNAANLKAQAERVQKEMEENARIKELEAQKSKSIRKNWKFEVVNESLVPRKYLSVDESKIKQALKEEIRDIPGVRIFQDSNVVIR